MTKEEA